MKKFSFVIVIVIVIVLTGCATTRQTQVVERVSRDTLYLSNIQYDSVYVFQDHLTDRSRDTIYVKDVQYEYKYKFLRDTVYKVQIDTIPVIREDEVVKTEKYIPDIYKWSFATCIILFCVFCVFCVLKIKRV